MDSKPDHSRETGANMKWHQIGLLAVMLGTTGCAELKQALAEANKPPARPTAAFAHNVPVVDLQLQTGNKAVTRNSGTEIELQALTFGAERKVATAESSTMGNCALGGGCFFYRQMIPYYIIQGNLIFDINITNHMDQPLRLTNAIVAIRVGGRDIPKSEYRESVQELSQLMVLPGSTMNMRFTGPAISGIDDGTAITFALYDVTTALDAASNPSKRGAFVWNYRTAKSFEQRTEQVEYECMQIRPNRQCMDHPRGACPMDYKLCEYEGVDKTPLTNLIR